VECVELQDLEQPSGEFSRLMAESDVTAEPAAKPGRWRQIRALMKVRVLSEWRMPSLWITRILTPVIMVLVGAARWAVPDTLSTFDRLQLKAGYYVDNLPDGEPGLAFLSSTPSGLFFA